ncbi:uncharacterized protein LOC121595556 isoform X2 [Anopheles merus]|uniref:uncharacterized protein LOC121595556 isoform X2 n=1 Tax=Anopheles merus TaxID=30066 RepID=UPI001BE4AEF8|nr:uncharacterized protein LOC121595556 isoform X2 [Anopheles merus]
MGNPNAGPCGMRLALGEALRGQLGLCIFCRDVVIFECMMCVQYNGLLRRICPYDVLHDGKMMSQAAEESDTGNGVPSSPIARRVPESSATPWRPMTFPDLCGFPAAQQLYGLPVPIDLSFLRSPVSGDEEASGQPQQQQQADLPSQVITPRADELAEADASGAPVAPIRKKSAVLVPRASGPVAVVEPYKQETWSDDEANEQDSSESDDCMIPASPTADSAPIFLQQENEEANMTAFNCAASIANPCWPPLHEHTDQPDQQPSVDAAMTVKPIGRAGSYGSLYAVWYDQLGSHDIMERIPDCVLFDPELPPDHQEPPPILTSLLLHHRLSTGELVTVPYGPRQMPDHSNE